MSSSAPPEPPLPPPPEFYCYECAATVSLPTSPPPAPAPARPLCPLCHSGFIEESPSPTPSSPPPPPPPLLFSGSSSSSLSDDPADAAAAAALEDLDFLMDPDFAGFAARRRHRLPDAAAVLQQQRPYHPRHGGEPPAAATSIAALPTVAVAEPAAVCAICKDDLPVASEARKLPCAHLYHSACIVPWLQMHNSCPVCRFRIPHSESDDSSVAPPAEEQQQDPPNTTRITIRFTTTARRRRVRVGADAAAPVSASPTQLAQAVTGDGAGGPANSGETVSSQWPPHPESDTVMSEAREGDPFFD